MEQLPRPKTGQDGGGGICGEEGQSSRMKIIQETELSGLSQQGFLPI